MIDEVLRQIESPFDEYEFVGIIADKMGFPTRMIKKGIKEGLLKINGKIVRKVMIVPIGAKVSFQEKSIKIPQKQRFDCLIDYLLKDKFQHEDIETLYTAQKKILFSYVIKYFDKFGYNVDELSQCSNNEQALQHLREFALSQKLIQKDSSLKKKNLVIQLINERENGLSYLTQIIDHLKLENNGIIETSVFSDFGKALKNVALVNLVYPFSENLKWPELILKVLKRTRFVLSKSNQVEFLREKGKILTDFSEIKKKAEKSIDSRMQNLLHSLLGICESKIKERMGGAESGVADLLFIGDERTYNVQNFPIVVTGQIVNKGTGIAQDVSIIVDGPFKKTHFVEKLIGPNQSRSISFELNKSEYDLANKNRVSFSICFKNDLSEDYSITAFAEIISQNDNLPWDELKRQNPYSIRVIRDKNKFFGREKLLDDLKWNIIDNSTMSSFIIFGQKRIGKSSIIRTLENMLAKEENIIFCYKSIGDIRTTQASKTFQKLADSITKSVLSLYRMKSGKSFSFEYNTTDESLSELISLIDMLSYENEKLRFIIALDEFDELNPEFFYDDEIGKTLALNLGKGLNEKDNVSIMLIGSETMDNKSKQGMRLNTFETKKIDTFSKQTEFRSFSKIITEPSKECLKFQPLVIDWIFDYTNGNPYFTNLICDKIFNSAYEKKISYIDMEFAKREIAIALNQYSKREFEHFWVDGLPEKDIIYQKVLDRRQRVLFALSSLIKDKENTSWPNIKRKIKRPHDFVISDIQFEETFNEFIKRGVFQIDKGKSVIVPKLFEDWLIDKGLYQVIAEMDDRDEFIDKLQQEEKLKLRDEEILDIRKKLGEDISFVQLRQFFGQIESIASRRNIADLLKEIYYVSPDQVSQHLKSCYTRIWPQVSLSYKKMNLRTDAEIITFSRSYNQNKLSFQLLSKTFKFSAAKVFKNESEISKLKFDEVNHLIVYEPLIDCPYFYRNALSLLLKKINPIFVTKIKIHVLCFIISDEAYQELEELLSNTFNFDFIIHKLQVVPRSEISPFISEDGCQNNNTWRTICEYYNETDSTSTLVKIGSTVPYQNLPFIWLKNANYNPLVSTNETSIKDYNSHILLSKSLKELKFNSENKNLEFKASLAYPAKNWKKIYELTLKLKSIESVEGREGVEKEIEKLWKITPAKSEISEIKHSIAKTLAAFHNTDGGELYVGIEDDFTVTGLIADMLRKSYSEENVRKIFDQIVKDFIGNEFSSWFKLIFIDVGDFPVLQIIVKKGKDDIWIKRDSKGKMLDEGQEFYIRKQQESVKLQPKEYAGWKKSRL